MMLNYIPGRYCDFAFYLNNGGHFWSRWIFVSVAETTMRGSHSPKSWLFPINSAKFLAVCVCAWMACPFAVPRCCKNIWKQLGDCLCNPEQWPNPKCVTVRASNTFSNDLLWNERVAIRRNKYRLWSLLNQQKRVIDQGSPIAFSVPLVAEMAHSRYWCRYRCRFQYSKKVVTWNPPDLRAAHHRLGLNICSPDVRRKEKSYFLFAFCLYKLTC